MLSVVRTTALTPLISTAEAKANLRVEHSDEDDVIARLCLAVTDLLDGYTGETGRALVQQTIEWVVEYEEGVLTAPVGPVSSITSVTYLDEDGDQIDTEVTLSVTASLLGEDKIKLGRVEDGVTPAYLKIEYVAGPSQSNPTPSAIIQAAHLLIGHYYENREDSTAMKVEAIPMCATTLIDRHRKRWVA